MAIAAAPNPLLTTSPGTESSPQVQLHPLALITISDYITRHFLRKQQSPIVGAIVGQRVGHDVTMQVAFECKTATTPDGATVFDEGWFQQRLDQYKETFKNPQLDITGWFSLGDPTGPRPFHISIHQQLQNNFGYDGVCLLLFHANETPTGGKLPLAVYESVDMGKNATEMDTADTPSSLKFRALTYHLETDEAEMIAVNHVSKGGGNATAIDGTTSGAQPAAAQGGGGAGKAPKTNGAESASSSSSSIHALRSAGVTTRTPAGSTAQLNAEEEERIATIQAKMDAVAMMRDRVKLLGAYLAGLPPSYLTDPALNPAEADGLDLPLLRSIKALCARSNLVVPPNADAYARERTAQERDAAVLRLLGGVTDSVCGAAELGRKVQVWEAQRGADARNGTRNAGAGSGADPGAGVDAGGVDGGEAIIGGGRGGRAGGWRGHFDGNSGRGGYGFDGARDGYGDGGGGRGREDTDPDELDDL